MKKLLVNASAVLAATFASSPLAVLAQGGILNPNDPGGSFDVEQTFTDVLSTILDWILIIAGFLAVIYLIWAGIQYISGAGGGADAAKKQIINAVIGIIVIVLAYAIVRAAIALVGG